MKKIKAWWSDLELTSKLGICGVALYLFMYVYVDLVLAVFEIIVKIFCHAY